MNEDETETGNDDIRSAGIANQTGLKHAVIWFLHLFLARRPHVFMPSKGRPNRRLGVTRKTKNCFHMENLTSLRRAYTQA